MIKIQVGYEIVYDFPQPTPMIMVFGTHFTRVADVISPDYPTASQPRRCHHLVPRQFRKFVQPDARSCRSCLYFFERC